MNKPSKDYERRHDDDGDPIECDCCGYFAPTREFELADPSRPGDLTEHTFCRICASTPACNVLRYPEQCHDSDMLRTAAWIGNAILEAIYSGPRPDGLIRDLRLAWRSGEKPEDYPHLFED